MMKTIAASTLLLFVVAPVVASTKLSVRRHLEVASNEVCFSNLLLGTDAGCNFVDLEQALTEKLANNVPRCGSERTAVQELALMMQVDESLVQEKVESMCRSAYQTKLNTEGVTFGDIADHEAVFQKAFFDGKTDWNHGRQHEDRFDVVYDKLSDYPGSRIGKFFTNNGSAKNSIFEWPSASISNFDDCPVNAAMCCWVQDRQAGDGNGNCEQPYEENCADADPADNTDICLVDMSLSADSARVAGGYAFYPGDVEGDAHCHGFAWSNDDLDVSSIFKGNALFYVSMYDHLRNRGYVTNVPGAPMCGCLDRMPVVSRADCTQVDINDKVRALWEYDEEAAQLSVTIKTISLEFNACQGVNDNNNDLQAYFEGLHAAGDISDDQLADFGKTIVGVNGCAGAIEEKVTQVFG